jgi:hypothetical protein
LVASLACRSASPLPTGGSTCDASIACTDTPRARRRRRRGMLRLFVVIGVVMTASTRDIAIRHQVSRFYPKSKHRGKV